MCVSNQNQQVIGTPVGVNGPNVALGGVTYCTVWIGNRLWLAENLRGDFNIGITRATTATQWNAQASTVDIYANINSTGNAIEPTAAASNDQGSLYNYEAVISIRGQLASLNNGWRIPTQKDFTDTLAILGSSGNVFKSPLQAITASSLAEWRSGNGSVQGTNLAKFNGTSPGYIKPNGSVDNAGDTGTYIADDPAGPTFFTLASNGSYLYNSTNNDIASLTPPSANTTAYTGLNNILQNTVTRKYCGFSLRLVYEPCESINYLNFNGLNSSLTYSTTDLPLTGAENLTNYPTIWIGAQKWMAVNVVDFIPNVPLVNDINTWAALTTPACCYYNGNPEAIHCAGGLLFNAYAISDINAATNGNGYWRVPTDSDFTELGNFLGGSSVAGGKLKSNTPSATTYWSSPNTGADNSSGFSAIGAGFRGTGGSFLELNQTGAFWTSTVGTVNTANYARKTAYNAAPLTSFQPNKKNGYSVRLLIPSVPVTVNLVGAIPGDNVNFGGNYLDLNIYTDTNNNSSTTLNLRNDNAINSNVTFQAYPGSGRVATFAAQPGLVVSNPGTATASATYNNLTTSITVTVTFSIPPVYELIVTNNVNFEGNGYLNNFNRPVFIDGICTKFKFDIKNVGPDPTPTFDTNSDFLASRDSPVACNQIFGALTLTHSNNTNLLSLPANTDLKWGYSIVGFYYSDGYVLNSNQYVSVEYLTNFSPVGSCQSPLIPFSGGFGTIALDYSNNNGLPNFTAVGTNTGFPFEKIQVANWISEFNNYSDIQPFYSAGSINIGNSYTFSFTIPQITIQTLRFNIYSYTYPAEFSYEWFDENNISIGIGNNSPEIPPLAPSQTYRVEVTWTPQSAHNLSAKIYLSVLDCDGETTSTQYKVDTTLGGTAIDPNGGTITNLNCDGINVTNGPLVEGVDAVGTSFTITYTGGDGGQYDPQVVSSTGVTGLVATLTPSTGTLSSSGSFTFNLTGTPDSGGTAAFAISFPGPNNTTVDCTVLLDVTPVIILSGLNCFNVVYPFGGPPFFTNTTISSNLEIGYTAIQGGEYAGDTIQSTGVTGLTLTLDPTTVTSNSSGNFTGTISGIATQVGQACFPIAIGGYEGDDNTYYCNLCIAIEEQSATISSIDCSNPLITGSVLYPGIYVASSNITITVSYTGGNGGAYPYTSFNSTSVTGLTAYLSPGSFAGSETAPAPGTLVFTVIGSPSGPGTAIFLINIGGQSCTLELPVSATEGTVSSLDCNAATTNTTLISGASVNGVVLSVPYTGGNGGAYTGQTLTSNFPNLGAVTGTLAPGTLAVGNGSLSITLSGTMPAGFVPITFDFEFPEGSEPCLITLTPEVDAGTAEVDCNNLNVVGTITYPTPIPNNNPVELWLNYSNSNGGSYGPATFISQPPGVGGLTATLPEGQFNLDDGFVQLYVTGTPQSSGNAIFVVNIGGTECTLTVPVGAPEGTIDSLNCSGASSTLSAPLVSGQIIAPGTTFSVNYFGSNGGSYLGNTSNSSNIVTGITAQSSPGTFSQPNGSVLYTLSGTPNGSGNATFSIQVGNKTCVVSIPVSDKAGEISALNCNAASFSGSFTQGFFNTVTGTIPYTGGNGGAYGTYTNTQSGLTLTIPGGTFNNGAGNVNFTITGNPTTSGTVSFPITLGGVSCNLQITVGAPIPIIDDLRCSETVVTGTLSVGQPSTVSFTLNYYGSNQQPYPQNTSNSTGVTGLTATTPSGTLTNPTGTLVYTVTGTPQTTGTATFLIIIGSKSCTVTIPVTQPNYFGPESPSPCQEVTYTDPGCEVLNETCTVLVNGDEVSYTTVSITDPCQISFQVPCDVPPGSTATITFEDCNGDVIIEEDLPIGDPLPIYPTQDSGCPGDTITVLDAGCILSSTTSIEVCTDSGCVNVDPLTISIIQNPPLPCAVVFTIPTSIPAPTYPADANIEFHTGTYGNVLLATVPFTVLDCPTEGENTFDPPGGALPGDEVTFTNPNCDIVTEDLDQILVNGVPATITGTTPAPECSVTFDIPTGIDCGNSTIEFVDELGNVIGSQEYPIGCEGNDDGTYTVTFTPQDEGCHLIYFKTTGEDYCVYQADGPFEVGVPVTITINLIDYADCLGTVPPVACVDPLRVTGFIRPCCTQDGSKDVDLNFVEYQTTGCKMYSIECESVNCGTFTRSNCTPSGCYGYVDPTEYSFKGAGAGIPNDKVYMCSGGEGIQNTTNSTYFIKEIESGETVTLLGPELINLYPFNNSTWITTGSLNWDPLGLCPYVNPHVYSPENSQGGSVLKNGILSVGKNYVFEFYLYTSNFPITITAVSGASTLNIPSPGGFFPSTPTTFNITAGANGISFIIPSVPKGACFQLLSLREAINVKLSCCNCLRATLITNAVAPITFYYTRCGQTGPIIETINIQSGVVTTSITCIVYGSLFPVNKSDVQYIQSISYDQLNNTPCP